MRSQKLLMIVLLSSLGGLLDNTDAINRANGDV